VIVGVEAGGGVVGIVVACIMVVTASKASAASASVAELPRHLKCGEIGAQKEHHAPRQGIC